MHRKIQFLLDIRGLLIINKIKGDYVEFGVYRGEMMYSAAQIFGQYIDKFVGLDTFSGLPQPQQDDDKLFVFESWGFMACAEDQVREILDGFDPVLIAGDFREKSVQDQYKKIAGPISVLTIDCNWPSSVEAAFQMSSPYLQSGSIIFIDDYFVATKYQNFNDPLIQNAAAQHNYRLIEFKTYPPSARAFLVETTK